MMVKAKICGIRTIKSAQQVVNAGAFFLGLNFVINSKRVVSISQAVKIVEKVGGRVKIVGVFQNAKCDYINQLVKKLALDYVQLHGDEDSEFKNRVEAKVIKAIRLGQNIKVNQLSGFMRSYQADYFLLDREKQGKGNMVDREIAKLLSDSFPIILAGGLNPENVGQIIKYVKPYAVDVASGIETSGLVDIKKVKKFIEIAKGVPL